MTTGPRLKNSLNIDPLTAYNRLQPEIMRLVDDVHLGNLFSLASQDGDFQKLREMPRDLKNLALVIRDEDISEGQIIQRLEDIAVKALRIFSAFSKDDLAKKGIDPQTARTAIVRNFYRIARTIGVQLQLSGRLDKWEKENPLIDDPVERALHQQKSASLAAVEANFLTIYKDATDKSGFDPDRVLPACTDYVQFNMIRENLPVAIFFGQAKNFQLSDTERKKCIEAVQEKLKPLVDEALAKEARKSTKVVFEKLAEEMFSVEKSVQGKTAANIADEMILEKISPRRKSSDAQYSDYRPLVYYWPSTSQGQRDIIELRNNLIHLAQTRWGIILRRDRAIEEQLERVQKRVQAPGYFAGNPEKSLPAVSSSAFILATSSPLAPSTPQQMVAEGEGAVVHDLAAMQAQLQKLARTSSVTPSSPPAAVSSGFSSGPQPVPSRAPVQQTPVASVIIRRPDIQIAHKDIEETQFDARKKAKATGVMKWLARGALALAAAMGIGVVGVGAYKSYQSHQGDVAVPAPTLAKAGGQKIDSAPPAASSAVQAPQAPKIAPTAAVSATATATATAEPIAGPAPAATVDATPTSEPTAAPSVAAVPTAVSAAPVAAPTTAPSGVPSALAAPAPAPVSKPPVAAKPAAPSDSKGLTPEVSAVLGFNTYALGSTAGATPLRVHASMIEGSADATAFSDAPKNPVWNQKQQQAAETLLKIYRSNPERLDKKTIDFVVKHEGTLDHLADQDDFSSVGFQARFNRSHKHAELFNPDGVYNELTAFERVMDIYGGNVETLLEDTAQIRLTIGNKVLEPQQRYVKAVEFKAAAAPAGAPGVPVGAPATPPTPHNDVPQQDGGKSGFNNFAPQHLTLGVTPANFVPDQNIHGSIPDSYFGAATSPKSADRVAAGLNSDDLDVAFKAFNNDPAVKTAKRNVARDRNVSEGLRQYVMKEDLAVADFERQRRSRSVFDKLADAASYAWSGTTPEERVQNKRGVGGIRGVFLTDARRRAELEKLADAAMLETKPITAPARQAQAQSPVVAKTVSVTEPMTLGPQLVAVASPEPQTSIAQQKTRNHQEASDKISALRMANEAKRAAEEAAAKATIQKKAEEKQANVDSAIGKIRKLHADNVAKNAEREEAAPLLAIQETYHVAAADKSIRFVLERQIRDSRLSDGAKERAMAKVKEMIGTNGAFIKGFKMNPDGSRDLTISEEWRNNLREAAGVLG